MLLWIFLWLIAWFDPSWWILEIINRLWINVCCFYDCWNDFEGTWVLISHVSIRIIPINLLTIQAFDLIFLEVLRWQQAGTEPKPAPKRVWQHLHHPQSLKCLSSPRRTTKKGMKPENSFHWAEQGHLFPYFKDIRTFWGNRCLH